MTLDNIQIEGNQAHEGGGIYFYCNESKKFGCSLNIRDRSKIFRNLASIGGGIRWNWIKPVIDSSSSVT